MIYNFEWERMNIISSSGGREKKWNYVWKLNFFLRIKIFYWKTCRGIMFLCGKLGMRILNFDMKCRICGVIKDTNVYLILSV